MLILKRTSISFSREWFPISTSVKELPWYLKKMPFLAIAFCFAPLAILIVLLNWKMLDKETKGNRFFVASWFLLIFSIGLMPRNILSVGLSIGVVVFLSFATYIVMVKRR